MSSQSVLSEQETIGECRPGPGDTGQWVRIRDLQTVWANKLRPFSSTWWPPPLEQAFPVKKALPGLVLVTFSPYSSMPWMDGMLSDLG